jgi:RNA polymerase sigma-70 factor (ECF subfamily)
VVLRINRDQAQAEEILQDVYVGIWRGARSYDALRSTPMTWLISMARYRAIDSLRRRAAEPRRAVATAGSATDGEPLDLLETVACEGLGPEETAEQTRRAQAVRVCLESLGPEQRQAIALAYYRGLSHSEVADRLAQPLGSVKSWIRRGLQALQRCLGQADAFGSPLG